MNTFLVSMAAPRPSWLPLLLLSRNDLVPKRVIKENTLRIRGAGGPVSLLLWGLGAGCGPTAPATSSPLPAPPAWITLDCGATDNALRLQCAVEVRPPQPIQIHVERSDGQGEARVFTGDGDLAEHIVVVYFLAPETEHTLTAVAASGAGPRAHTTAHTSAVPLGLSSRLQGTGEAPSGLIGAATPCSDDAIAVIYDLRTGGLVWYQELDPLGRLDLFHMVRFTEDHTILGETAASIVEVDLQGQQLVRLARGQHYGPELHHDIFRRGDVYYGMYQRLLGGLGFQADRLDALLLLDRRGVQLARWLPEDHLDLPADWSGDWMHTNTIFVDEAGDIYLSLLTQAAVIKLDGALDSPTFGDPLWILEGGDGALQGDIEVDWSGIGGPDAFLDQHDVSLASDGRLVLLDNAHGRGLVLVLDEETSTARVTGSYPTAEDACRAQGTAAITVDGTVVVACSTDRIRAYGGDAQLRWEASVSCDGGEPASVVRWSPLDGW
ncbi:MAG TPA: hypothetical protein ENK18_10395 [Deltaproteobacteria bacterium]|nr:hypothetical protein [Deltaproteobacteria bacterium]